MASQLSVRKLVREKSDEGPWGLLVESTAPLNVEAGSIDPTPTDLVEPVQQTGSEELRDACARLALAAEDGGELSIVIQVHGFNNPAKVAFERYRQAWDYYRSNAGRHMLYVGYRWPGEAMGSTLGSSFKAIPPVTPILLALSAGLLAFGLIAAEAASSDKRHWWPFIGKLLWFGMALVAVLGAFGALARIVNLNRRKSKEKDVQWKGPLFLIGLCVALALCLFVNAEMAPFDWGVAFNNPLRGIFLIPSGLSTSVPILLGGLLVALPVAVLAFRGLVYFRDAYRAEHFGVPDLVEFVRHLDAELDRQLSPYPRRRVALSFIGHSMGGLVVTNTIRILTDVFDQKSISPLDGLPHSAKPDRNIGRRLLLGNLVLVSPDIPAEALLSGRSNFLASSIRRFRETHLFSNEGDVVLRCVSSLANSFSFPSSNRKHGQRLGNAHVTWAKRGEHPPFGIVNRDPATNLPKALATSDFLEHLYVGRDKITDIQEGLQKDKNSETLATCINYFDCTDYADNAEGKAPFVPALSYGRRRRVIGPLDLGLLLFNYLRVGWLFGNWRKDVHSAYFDFPTGKKLIYSCAHGGVRLAVRSLSSPEKAISEQANDFHQHLAERGLQLLVSQQSIEALAPQTALPMQPDEWSTRLFDLLRGVLKSLNTIEPAGIAFSAEQPVFRLCSGCEGAIDQALFDLLTSRGNDSELARQLLEHLEGAADARVEIGGLSIRAVSGLIRCEFR